MTKSQLAKFLRYLCQKNLVLAPQREEGELIFDKVEDTRKVELTAELPLHSFKRFLVPPRETLLNYKKNNIKLNINSQNQILFGLTVVDLKAVTLLNQVFAKDPYFQERMTKTIIVGHSLLPEKEFQFFIEDYKEDILEHLKFDLFLVVQKNRFKIYTGSEDGQRLLDDFGYQDFEHIEYVGPIKEEGPNPQMLKIKKTMEENPNHPIWKELGKICIECGKCAMICPTCFCFDIDDQPGLNDKTGERARSWGSCFYTDFTEVAGLEIDSKKPKFLSTTEERIRFWYEHKFVRIPHEFSIPGCVGCGRCTKVCPVGIDIKKNLQKLLKAEVK